ncbi:hypothetical protein ACFE04_011656 [Oxalis oulophora]
MSATAMNRLAVVTGANKGVGFEICRQLASDGVQVILTARNQEKGIEALRKLYEVEVGVSSNVIFHQLDVNNPATIASLVKFIETHFAKLDILVNNAGVGGLTVHWEALKAFRVGGGVVSDENAHIVKDIMVQTYEEADECIQTNYHGTVTVTQSLLPLLQKSTSPRIVNLSSTYGYLKHIPSKEIKAELENVDPLTVEKLDAIVRKFLKDFRENKLEANGWPLTVSAYKMSKIAINAYTRVLARSYPNFRVNCVHPGFVKTDMTGYSGTLSPEEGARAPVFVALLPDDGPTGFFFDQTEPSSF